MGISLTSKKQLFSQETSIFKFSIGTISPNKYEHRHLVWSTILT